MSKNEFRMRLRNLRSPYAAACLGASAAGIVIFYSFEWTILRGMFTSYLCMLFQALGTPALKTGEFELQLGDRFFAITPECTYVDWFLVTLPFATRANRTMKSNLLIIVAWLVAVGVGNSARVLAAMLLATKGYDWGVVHDLVDHVFFYPSMALVIILWSFHVVGERKRRRALDSPAVPSG